MEAATEEGSALMFHRLITRLRPPSLSLVVALLALVVATTGTAVAAGPTLMSIADHTTPANTATVSAAGALSVSGNVAIVAPKTPFDFTAQSFEDGDLSQQMNPTAATIAITGFRVSNGTPNGMTMRLYEYPETNIQCVVRGTPRYLGDFSVNAGDTYGEQTTTPIIVKPLAGSPKWCLITFASGTSSQGVFTTYNGYVISGSFTPPN